MSGKHTQRNHQPFKPAFCLRRRNAQGACTGIRHALPSPIPPPNAPLRRSTSADYHLQVLLVDPPLARLPDLDRAWSGVRFVQHCLYPNHALFRLLFLLSCLFLFLFLCILLFFVSVCVCVFRVASFLCVCVCVFFVFLLLSSVLCFFVSLFFVSVLFFCVPFSFVLFVFGFALLCSALLCLALLCFVVLLCFFGSVLFCSVLFCSVLFCFVLSCFVLFCFALPNDGDAHAHNSMWWVGLETPRPRRKVLGTPYSPPSLV